jgi:hypothetical protein
MRLRVSRLAFLLCVLAASSTLRAQDSASITGVITDSTGAVVPGAQVTLTNSHTGVKLTVMSDAKGTYHFLNVPPSPGYTELISHTGFSDVSITNVDLSVGVTRTQNAKLLVGGTAEQVSVNAGSQEVTLDTTDASIGNSMSVDQLQELPVQDRNAGIATLFALQPGVDINSGAVTGARIDQSSVTIDGMDVNDIAAGTTFAIVGNAPIDSVEEFRGTVAGLVAGLGTGSGGQYQLITRSGTNSFHGNVNEYHRDTTTAANTFFNNLDGLSRTPLIRNQFGGNIGGPIKRDKLFFFFNFGDSRIIQSASTEATVPLDSFRNGTLNYINSNAGCTDSSRLNTAPTCISTLSAAQVAALDPQGIGFNQGLLTFINSRYPHVNDFAAGDGVNTGGYRFSFSTPDFLTTYVGRIDYNLNHAHRIFGRFTIGRENAIESAPAFPTDPVSHPFIDRSYSYVVSDVWTIGNNKVNQFYYGDVISKYDFPNAYNPTGVNAFAISGLSAPYSGTDGQKRRVPIPEFRDDFNWQRGSHSIVAGGTFKFIKTDSNLINNFNFVGIGQSGSGLTGGLTDNAHPSLRPNDINGGQTALNDYDSLFPAALGVIGSISTNYNYTHTGAAAPAATGGPRAYRYFETEAYIGDTWKLTSKLNMTYGVRYQLYSVPYEAHGQESIEYTDAAAQNKATLPAYIAARQAQIDSPTPVLPIYSVKLGGKANNAPSIYAPSYKDFAPRVAFAYNPTHNTVVNGSAAIVYDRTVINAINFLQDQISYLFSNTQTNNIASSSPYETIATNPRIGPGLTYDSSLVPAPSAITSPYTPYVFSNGVPYGLAEGATNFVISPTLKDPYSIAFNAGVQQELPFHMILKLNYAGRLGRRLLADADAGQILDTPDVTKKSSQTMAQAFAALTTQTRAQQANGTLGTAPLTPQPWFENVLGAYQGALGAGSTNTDLVNYFVGQLAPRGDMSDMLQALSYYSVAGVVPGFLPTNIGLPSQFGSNAYLTNQGSSNYHALLLTISKNTSAGLHYDFNYTWGHSIDNTSLSANANSLFSNSGFICDITQPRACRGTSDFDVTQELNSNFVYDLPVGRGKRFLGGDNRLVDEALGGWSLSGITYYRTGLAVTPYSGTYLASFDNQDPAIFTGNKSDLKTRINVSNGTVYNFAGGAAGAAKVLSEFRGPIGLEYGTRGLIRSAGYFNFDAGLAKTFPIVRERLNLKFRADAFNILNHPNFSIPGVNIIGNASTFGQVTSTIGQASGASSQYRVGQFSLRLEF